MEEEENSELEEHMERLDRLIIDSSGILGAAVKAAILQITYKAILAVAPEFMARPHRIQFSEN